MKNYIIDTDRSNDFDSFFSPLYVIYYIFEDLSLNIGLIDKMVWIICSF